MKLYKLLYPYILLYELTKYVRNVLQNIRLTWKIVNVVRNNCIKFSVIFLNIISVIRLV